jgi:hypothetical protein
MAKSRVNGIRWLTGVALLTLLAACTLAGTGPSETPSPQISPSAEPSSTISPTATPAVSATADTPRRCPAQEGSVNDVATEPPWRQFTESRQWTTADGCLIRIDVLVDRAGPVHCGFEAARVIVTGIPVGNRSTSSLDSYEYIRDPTDVFGDPVTAAAFDPDADLPVSGSDTGFRNEGTQLWVDVLDPSSIYLVSEDSIERWPLDPEPTGCT